MSCFVATFLIWKWKSSKEAGGIAVAARVHFIFATRPANVHKWKNCQNEHTSVSLLNNVCLLTKGQQNTITLR